MIQNLTFGRNVHDESLIAATFFIPAERYDALEAAIEAGRLGFTDVANGEEHHWIDAQILPRHDLYYISVLGPRVTISMYPEFEGDDLLDGTLRCEDIDADVTWHRFINPIKKVLEVIQ